jgi:hypothetical protein
VDQELEAIYRGGGLRSFIIAAPALAWCFTLLLHTTVATAQSLSEYEVKAAFLYKFASFVQWPDDADARPICIGILGEDHFGGALDQVVRGKMVRGRPFIIRRFHSPAEAAHCEILFISDSERPKLPEILIILRGKPVLTVSEVPGFCERGGAINLKLIDSQGGEKVLRFEINPVSGEHSGLRFSAKLLSLGRLTPEAVP